MSFLGYICEDVSDESIIHPSQTESTNFRVLPFITRYVAKHLSLQESDSAHWHRADDISGPASQHVRPLQVWMDAWRVTEQTSFQLYMTL